MLFLLFAGRFEVPHIHLRWCPGPNLQIAPSQSNWSSLTTECHWPPMGALQLPPSPAPYLPNREILSPLACLPHTEECFIYHSQTLACMFCFKLPLFWHILWWKSMPTLLYCTAKCNYLCLLLLFRSSLWFLLPFSFLILLKMGSSIFDFFIRWCRVYS